MFQSQELKLHLYILYNRPKKGAIWKMKYIYLCLAIVGAVWPYTYFIPFLREHGIDIKLFASELFANNISSFFASDFLISCLIFWVFLYQEVKKHNIKHWWIYIVATLTVGLSFSLPLFLYFRQKAIERQTI